MPWSGGSGAWSGWPCVSEKMKKRVLTVGGAVIAMVWQVKVVNTCQTSQLLNICSRASMNQSGVQAGVLMFNDEFESREQTDPWCGVIVLLFLK